jgi:hypothetical protein
MKEEALKLADKKIETKDIHQLLEWADEAEDMIRKLVAELDKQGERVGYACQIVEADFRSNVISIEMLDEDYTVSAGVKFLCDTAPQTKPLSSQEIRKLAVECGAYENDDTGSLYPDDMCIGSFVRAIEEKHGIK